MITDNFERGEQEEPDDDEELKKHGTDLMVC